MSSLDKRASRSNITTTKCSALRDANYEHLPCGMRSDALERVVETVVAFRGRHKPC